MSPDSRLDILALGPQTPNGYNAGGGPARAYFMLRCLARAHRLHLAVLDDPQAAPLPADLQQLCAAVFWPGPEWRRAKLRPRSRLRNALAAAARLLAPWTMDLEDFFFAAESNCVERPEKAASGVVEAPAPVRAAHRLYGWWLLALAAVRVACGLRPARGFERRAMFRSLLPSLASAFRAKPPHVVWVEHTYLFPEALRLLRLFPGAALVVDSHNVEHLLHRRLRGLVRSRLARSWYALQARAVRGWERLGYRASRLTYCCSEEDAAHIRRLAPGPPVAVVGNGVDTAFYRPNRREATDPTLLFTGSFGYLPNRDAVTFFHRDVLPLVRPSVPGCRFCIAGSQAQAEFGPLAAGDPFIEIASDVPDIRPFFDRAWVVVVPLRAGSGTRFKILEAMAMGCPVVSTSLGAEGLAATPGEHLLIADDPKALAEAVLSLLRHPDRRSRMGACAREFVKASYDWSVLCRRAAAAFHEHVVAPRSG